MKLANTLFSYHCFHYQQDLCWELPHLSSYFSVNTLMLDEIWSIFILNKTCEGKTFVLVNCWLLDRRFILMLLLAVLILFCPNGFVSSWQILIYYLFLMRGCLFFFASKFLLMDGCNQSSRCRNEIFCPWFGQTDNLIKTKWIPHVFQGFSVFSFFQYLAQPHFHEAGFTYMGILHNIQKYSSRNN